MVSLLRVFGISLPDRISNSHLTYLILEKASNTHTHTHTHKPIHLFPFPTSQATDHHLHSSIFVRIIAWLNCRIASPRYPFDLLISALRCSNRTNNNTYVFIPDTFTLRYKNIHQIYSIYHKWPKKIRFQADPLIFGKNKNQKAIE